MTKDELDSAVLEYHGAITYINQAKAFGYELPLSTFQFFTENQQREMDKLGVAFQTDFLNETIKEFLEKERPIPETLKKVHNWFSEIIKTKKEAIDWELMMMAEGNILIEVLRTHYDTLPNKIYWQMVSDCYTRSDLAHSDMDIVFDYLNDNRSEKEYLMNEEDREFFNNLPEEITIYRGCTKKEIESGQHRLSWTLDKSIAEFFAYTYINPVHEDRGEKKDKSKFDIVEKTVSKKDLLCYFGGREEAEVLYITNN
jgi:hypothetical protein